MATFRGGDASDFDFTAVEPEDAIEYFRRKGYQVGFSWQDVWQDEHARAFTVAKAMTTDLLKDIRKVVDEAIADGIAFEDFQAKLEPILQARGWWGRKLMEDPLTGKESAVQLGSARRLGIIYDTNLRMSYSAGSWAQVERTKKDLPYLRYWDPDPNPRPQHLDWSGTVLPADDPWWDTHYPPNGWHCKCLADSLSESDLDRYGYQRSATAPPSPTYTYENPRTGEVSHVPEGIDPGFAYNPGKAGIRYAAEKDLAEKLATAEPDIRKAIESVQPPRALAPRDLNREIDRQWKKADHAIKRERKRAESVAQREGRAAFRETRARFRNTTPRAAEAILGYMRNSDPLNLAARTGRKTPEIVALDESLANQPRFVGRVFRGIDLSEAESQAMIEQWQREGRLSDPGFASSSRSAKVARRFGERITLKLRSRTGVEIYHFAPTGRLRRQIEVLFRPGVRFDVVSVIETRLADDSRGWIVEAKEEYK